MLKGILLGLVFSTFAMANFNDYNGEIPQTDSQQVDLLWTQFQDRELDPLYLFSALELMQVDDLKLIDKVRLNKMLNSFGQKGIYQLPKMLKGVDLKTAWAVVIWPSRNRQIIQRLSKADKAKVTKLKKYLAQVNSAKAMSAAKILETWEYDPLTANYRNGEYHNKVRLFLFCRKDRNYPCLFAMKDFYNQPVMDGDKLWTLPALAISSRGLDYYQTNGQTPQGVHTMDSVMPSSEPFRSFGAFRRVILSWVPRVANESHTKRFIPRSTHSDLWWHEANIARDAGRGLLRIHGTGRLNTDPSSIYYPHKPTSGCISTRELKYGKKTYIDQRLILDKLMEASGLIANYQNEELIKGVLHVIEIDNKKAKVTLKDLQALGLDGHGYAHTRVE
jgi:hypothetical protein